MEDLVGYRVEDNSDIEESIVNAARKHYKDGKYDMAIKLYLGLLNTGASSKLYMDVGLCYYKMGNFDSAIDYLTKAVSLDTNNSIAYSYIGNCYFRKLDAQNSIESWMHARSISPRDEFVCLNLAIAYFAKNMIYESVFYYEKYLKYSQNRETAQYKSIQKNINEQFRSANDYFIEAQKNRSRGESLNAEKNYLHAIKKYPIVSEYTKALADLYYNSKNYIQAIVYYELAIRDTIENKKEIYLKLAQCFQNINDYRMAYCFYNRYLKYSMSSQEEYLQTIKIVSTLKRQLDETVSDITLELAKRHYQNNEYFEALIEYENCIILNPELKSEYEYEIKKLRAFINPERMITDKYMQKGSDLFNKGEFRSANKYFTEVMNLSNPKSEEYKLAKSKLVNV